MRRAYTPGTAMSAATQTLTQEDQDWKPKTNPWLIAFVVSLAAFMEVLDTSIANVALPHIAGNLGASQDQSTWVLTSYLVSNAIVLPISGWLVSLFGRKRFFMTCIVIFTISSLLCGVAPGLGILLVARVIQGGGGGGLQPMAQAILADTFPPRLRGLAFSLYGVTAIFAPSIGPTLGGWITDNYSWRWIFLMNLPVGILALILVYQLVEDPPYLTRARLEGRRSKLDYVGFSLLALGVGALQILLDKGQEDDWFGSDFITTLAIVAGVCLVSLVIWELYQKAPIVDVRLFGHFNFATSSMMMFVVGGMSFATTVLVPQFLQANMGYTAESAGMVLSAAGFVLLAALPFIGMLTGRFQGRYLIATGWLLLTCSMFLSTRRIDLLISFSSATWLRIAQYAPLGLVFIPTTAAAYYGMPKSKSNAVAGLVNFMRNIGASVGTSVVTTVLARRNQFHQERLGSSLTPGNPTFQDTVSGLTHQLQQSGMSPHDAVGGAYGRVYQNLLNQASTLSYIDTFWMLTVAAGLMFFLAFLLQKNDPRAGEKVVAH
jgi:MFS transporter, DHA2 family, multidrug resistance protein